MVREIVRQGLIAAILNRSCELSSRKTSEHKFIRGADLTFVISRAFMLQRRGGALPEVEQQHYSADRLSFQYIFYGLLFYTRK